MSGADDEYNEELLKTCVWSSGAELPFPVGCKTDACVVMTRAQSSVGAAITAMVEIKKQVVQQSLRQARTQVL